tara:strand:+ start:124798 stop:125619 length:822 start_codon:yes stop_codon:yes gene_type:complete
MTVTPRTPEQQIVSAADIAEAKGRAAAAASSAAVAAKAASELAGGDGILNAAAYYNARYSEYLNQYRYFGNLRTGVAWAPATISVAVVALLLDKFDAAQLVFPIVISIIFLAIFWVNLHLQWRQMVNLRLAKLCDQEIHDASNRAGGQDVTLKSHKDLMTSVTTLMKSERWKPAKWRISEPATVALAIFLFVLAVSAGAVATNIDLGTGSIRGASSVEGTTETEVVDSSETSVNTEPDQAELSETSATSKPDGDAADTLESKSETDRAPTAAQ